MWNERSGRKQRAATRQSDVARHRTPAGRALAFVFGLAVCASACSAQTDTPVDDVGASDDELIEQFLQLHGKGVWLGFPIERAYVETALPAELELVDTGAVVPIIVFFNRINVEKLGVVPADLITPDWNEFVYLVPNVRFRQASECAPDRATTFNYLVYNYLNNPIGVKLLRTRYSSNRGFADIEFDDARLNATLDDSLQLTSKVVGPTAAKDFPPALRATWEKPALALGAKKKFVRYAPDWKNVRAAPIEGQLEITSSSFLGLPEKAFPFERGTASEGYQVDAQITLDRFVQCGAAR